MSKTTLPQAYIVNEKIAQLWPPKKKSVKTAMKQLLEYIDIDLDYAATKAAEHEFFK